MPEKRGTVVFFLGSPGAGKTRITETLLGMMEDGFNLNKDILAKSVTIKKPQFHKYFSQLYLTSKVNEDSLYQALLQLVAYNMRGRKPGSTAIVEGNFGKRLTKQMLQESLGDLAKYDLCLVHVVCKNPEVQFQRVRERKDPKDKAIVVNGKTYDLTNKKSFELYRALRMQEEMECIRKMCVPGCMRLIEVDNSNPSKNSNEITRLVWDLKEQIVGCSTRLASLSKVASLPNLQRSFEDSKSHTPDDGLMFSKNHTDTDLAQSPHLQILPERASCSTGHDSDSDQSSQISPIQKSLKGPYDTNHERLPFLSLAGRKGQTFVKADLGVKKLNSLSIAKPNLF